MIRRGPADPSPKPETESSGAGAKVSRCCRLAAEYAIYGIAALVPLAIVSTSHYILWETPKVALLNILTVVALAAWLNGIVQSGHVSVRVPPFFVPVIVFFDVYVLATVFSVSPVLSIFGIFDRSTGLINMANLVLLYFLIFNILTTREQQLRCLRIVAFSASAVALVGVLQYFGIGIPEILPAARGERVGSTLGNADYATPVLLLTIPLTLAFLAKRPLVYAIPVLLLGAMLLFSLPIQGLTGNWAPAPAQEQPGELSLTAEVTQTLSRTAAERVEVRKGLWEAGIKAALAHPALGTGPNTYRDVFTLYEPIYYVRMLPNFREDKPHNEFIEVAQSTGFVGLAAYLWMLAAVSLFFLRWILRNRRHPDAIMVAAIISGALAYAGYTAMVFHTIAAYTIFWVLLGVGAGLCQTAPRQFERVAKIPRPVAAVAGVISLIGMIVLIFTALRPVFAEANCALARSLIASGSGEESEVAELFEKAAYWHPYESRYLRSAANALSIRSPARDDGLSDSQLQERALAYISRSVKQEPYNATAYYNRALVYLRAGKSPEEVLEQIDKAIALYPYYIVAYNFRADIERSLGDHERALADRRIALSITPDDPKIMVEIGHDAIQSYKFHEAVEVLERAISAGDKTARARFLLGGAYELTGDRNKAAQAYQSALQIDPRDSLALRALARLAPTG